MTAPLPRIRKRAPVTPVVPVEAVPETPAVETPAPVPAVSRIRQRAAAPVPNAAAVVAPGTTSVVTTRKFSDGKAPEVESNVQRFPVDVPAVHATVNVGGKLSYQTSPDVWASIAVGIWFPCEATEDKIQETYLACSEWVERRLARENAIVQGDFTE